MFRVGGHPSGEKLCVTLLGQSKCFRLVGLPELLIAHQGISWDCELQPYGSRVNKSMQKQHVEHLFREPKCHFRLQVGDLISECNAVSFCLKPTTNTFPAHRKLGMIQKVQWKPFCIMG